MTDTATVGRTLVSGNPAELGELAPDAMDPSSANPTPPAEPVRKRKSAAEILAIADLPEEWVYVDEWDCDILVRGLTSAKRDLYLGTIMNQKGKDVSVNMQQATARLVSMCAIDADTGALMFPTPRDITALGNKSAAALDRLGKVAERLSGIAEDDMAVAVGNSVAIQNDGFTSV